MPRSNATVPIWHEITQEIRDGSHEIFKSRSSDWENLLSTICFPQRSDNESILRELTFTAPHPVTFTITPLASSFSASFTGCILSLNLISPSTWNEISRACESYWCCYCQLVQAVSKQREKDIHTHTHREKSRKGRKEKGTRDSLVLRTSRRAIS